jgi:phosphoribosyl-dephospho-CoA transferase
MKRLVEYIKKHTYMLLCFIDEIYGAIQKSEMHQKSYDPNLENGTLSISQNIICQDKNQPARTDNNKNTVQLTNNIENRKLGHTVSSH